MRKKVLTEYENPKAWGRVRELCQQIESGQLDDKIPEIMDEIHNLTPPTETQYLWVNCYEESCDMDRELMKSLKKRINQLKLNENMKKNKIRLTESQLQRVIKESVKKLLKEDVETEDDIRNALDIIQKILDGYKKPSEFRETVLEAGRLLTKAEFLLGKMGVTANVVY